MQTTYAELLERCETAAFEDAFPEDGVFTPKTIKERRYWYFQKSSQEGRSQKYVGPETPELLEHISRHKQARNDEKERRTLVSTMVRSFGMPRPSGAVGDVVAALAKAGVFRLRGVLVGTVAYQAYSAMLGVRLARPLLQTDDVDIAQFQNVSVAIGDSIPPLLEILQEVDPTFSAIPHLSGGHATRYAAKSGIRVDFLTPNEGANTDTPKALPAFHTDAQPLRFLDYLIHRPEPAVLLHNAGVHVLVPAPERYAVHKLIVARRRTAGVAKRDKDLLQAEALLDALVQKRPYELKEVWEEAFARGQTWRDLMLQSMLMLNPRVRDLVLKCLEQTRSVLPGLALTFQNPAPIYDSERDILRFTGRAGGSSVSCAISRETLDDHFGADALGHEGYIAAFRENRTQIEDMASVKFLFWPIEEAENVLIKTIDVPKLRQ